MKAYFCYVNEGSLPGHDVQHWLEAEARLLAESHANPSPNPQGRDNIAPQSRDAQSETALTQEDRGRGRLGDARNSQQLFRICALL